MICRYIEQTVLPTKSSLIRVPSQVSLIDCLVFKLRKNNMSMGMGNAQKKRFNDKEIYQKSSYDNDAPSETYLPFPISKHVEFTHPVSP